MRRKIIMAAAMAVLLASSSGCSRSAMTGAQGQYVKDTVPAGPGSYEESTTAAPPYTPIGEPVLDIQVDPDAPKGVAETMRVGKKVTVISDWTAIDPDETYSVVLRYTEDYLKVYAQDYERVYEEYGTSYKELMTLSTLQELTTDQSTVLSAITEDISAKIKAEQESWLTSVGAKEIKELGWLDYSFTMKGADICLLEGCNCDIEVSFRKQSEGLPVDISMYYGTYDPCGQKFMTPISSWLGVTSMQNAIIELSENGITFTESADDGGAVYEHTYRIDESCTYENCFGFDTLDISFMSEELKKAVAGGCALIRLDNGTPILLSGGRLYMDCRTRGLYEFAPAK